MGLRGEIYSSRASAGRRTYFYNVKENRNGDLFLNIVESKKHCTCKTPQLYKKNLFKCAPIAYIGDVLNKLGIKDDPDWQPYLNYIPLTPDCSDDELKHFMEKQPKPEWTCGMCPPYSNVLLSKDREIFKDEN